MKTSLRSAATALAALALSACSGNGGLFNNPIGGLNPCNPGTQVQLASPVAGQSGVNTNIGRIIIVANGSNNILNTQPNNWYVTLTGSFGDTIQGGNLNPVPFTSGPHPYSSDFYYASSIPTLNSGESYSAQLYQQPSGSCSAAPLQTGSTFST